MKRLLLLFALVLLMAAQGNAGEYFIKVGDTCYYGSGAYVLTLDSSVCPICGHCKPVKMKINPDQIYRGFADSLDSIQPGRQKVIWYETAPLYWLDPQTGYFHTPDGVCEMVPDSECVERDTMLTFPNNGGWYYANGRHLPITDCLKWQKTNTRVWRKVEDKP